MKSIRRALVLLSLAVVGCAPFPSSDEMARADYGTYPANYEAIVKGYFETTLKDPSSAQYRSVSPARQMALFTRFGERHYGYLTCVTYNAKNSFGAYTGYHTDGVLIRNGYVETYLPRGQWFGHQMC